MRRPVSVVVNDSADAILRGQSGAVGLAAVASAVVVRKMRRVNLVFIAGFSNRLAQFRFAAR
jgi:hypothetical protein